MTIGKSQKELDDYFSSVHKAKELAEEVIDNLEAGLDSFWKVLTKL